MKSYLMTALLTVFLVVIGGCSTHDSAGESAERIPTYRAQELIQSGATLIDVRSQSEYESGHIDGALHIVHSEIGQHLDKLGSDKNKPIVMYCGSGRRAGIAAQTLINNGYTQVYNAGGYEKLTERMGS